MSVRSLRRGSIAASRVTSTPFSQIEASLTDGESTTDDTTSYASASITPTANALVLVWVISSDAGTQQIPTLSGNGITWSQVATQTAGGTRRVTLFSGTSASPSTGAVTANFGATTQTGCSITIHQFVGSVTPTVRQSKVGTATGTSASVTLDTPPVSTSAVVGGLARSTVETTTAGSGFSVRIDDGYATPNVARFVEYDLTAVDGTAACSWTTASTYGMVVVEVGGP